MRPLLAALGSLNFSLQLCVSGCAVGPCYRKPATTLEKFHSAAAVEARPTGTPAPALETWWDGFARGAEAEALARYQQAVLRAAEEVENAFMSLMQLEAHQEELLTEVAALTRARDASQEAYQGGVIALTDVLDADRQLLNAQDEFAQTRADSARAAVGTFRALGGGW
jgi:outer membrane protein TolC